MVSFVLFQRCIMDYYAHSYVEYETGNSIYKDKWQWMDAVSFITIKWYANQYEFILATSPLFLYNLFWLYKTRFHVASSKCYTIYNSINILYSPKFFSNCIIFSNWLAEVSSLNIRLTILLLKIFFTLTSCVACHYMYLLVFRGSLAPSCVSVRILDSDNQDGKKKCLIVNSNNIIKMYERKSVTILQRILNVIIILEVVFQYHNTV